MATIDDFKPYGFMTASYEELANPAKVPSAWDTTAKEYATWLNDMAVAISRGLWPLWTAKGWDDAGGKAGAMALTQADLDLMKTLAHEFDRKGREPNSTSPHCDWFEAEDVLFSNDLPQRFQKAYKDSNANPKTMAGAFKHGGTEYFTASLVFVLKSRLQRPRAGQAAYWLGRPEAPVTQGTYSGWSPSAISGHAYQGLMGSLGCFLAHQAVLTAEEKLSLQQLAVDIGDRRVFAGVHYPSDNAMSWWCALEAIPYFGRLEQRAAMLDFVVGAIRESTVYQEMKKHPGHKPCIDILATWVK